MLLNGLLDLLNRLPAYRDLLAGVQAGAELRPQALVHSARPFVVAGLRAHTPGALVFITARSEMAQQVIEQALGLAPRRWQIEAESPAPAEVRKRTEERRGNKKRLCSEQGDRRARLEEPGGE